MPLIAIAEERVHGGPDKLTEEFLDKYIDTSLQRTQTQQDKGVKPLSLKRRKNLVDRAAKVKFLAETPLKKSVKRNSEKARQLVLDYVANAIQGKENSDLRTMTDSLKRQDRKLGRLEPDMLVARVLEVSSNIAALAGRSATPLEFFNAGAKAGPGKINSLAIPLLADLALRGNGAISPAHIGAFASGAVNGKALKPGKVTTPSNVGKLMPGLSITQMEFWGSVGAEVLTFVRSQNGGRQWDMNSCLEAGGKWFTMDGISNCYPSNANAQCVADKSCAPLPPPGTPPVTPTPQPPTNPAPPPPAPNPPPPGAGTNPPVAPPPSSPPPLNPQDKCRELGGDFYDGTCYCPDNYTGSNPECVCPGGAGMIPGMGCVTPALCEQYMPGSFPNSNNIGCSCPNNLEKLPHTGQSASGFICGCNDKNGLVKDQLDREPNRTDTAFCTCKPGLVPAPGSGQGTSTTACTCPSGSIMVNGSCQIQCLSNSVPLNGVCGCNSPLVVNTNWTGPQDEMAACIAPDIIRNNPCPQSMVRDPRTMGCIKECKPNEFREWGTLPASPSCIKFCPEGEVLTLPPRRAPTGHGGHVVDDIIYSFGQDCQCPAGSYRDGSGTCVAKPPAANPNAGAPCTIGEGDEGTYIYMLDSSGNPMIDASGNYVLICKVAR